MPENNTAVLEDFSDLGTEVSAQPDFSDLGVEVPYREETIKSAPPATFIDTVKSFFKDPSRDIAKAQNVYALSEVTGMQLRDVYDNYDVLRRSTKVTGLTPDIEQREYLSIVTGPLVATGVALNPIGTVAGLLAYGLLDKAIPVDKTVKAFEGAVGGELSDTARTTVELLDFVGKGLIVRGVFKKAPKLAEGFLKQKLVQYNMAKDIKLSPEQVKDIYQTGKLTTAEEQSLFGSLNLKGAELRATLKEGVKISIPPEKLVSLVDKPIWAKIKSIIGMKSKPKVVSETAGKPTKAVSGLLENKPGVQENIKVSPPTPSQAEGKVYYRGGPESAMPKGMTAQDVINYEQTELGNADVVVEKGIDPTKIKSDNLVWITVDAKSAKEYGKVVKQEYPNAKIIARDSQGGMLIDTSTLSTPTGEGQKPPLPPKPTAVGGIPGGTKVSGLARGVESKAIEDKLTKGFEGLSEYETVNIKDQAQRASDLLSKDYEQAKRIAMGEEEPPTGVKNFSVYTAVEARASKEGDVQTLMDLATKSSLNAESSGAAQTLRLLAERDPENPVTAIKDVVKARSETAKKRLKTDTGKLRKTEIASIKEHIKKVSPTKETWADFVRSLQC